jgi:hypothetical protein
VNAVKSPKWQWTGVGVATVLLLAAAGTLGVEYRNGHSDGPPAAIAPQAVPAYVTPPEPPTRFALRADGTHTGNLRDLLVPWSFTVSRGQDEQHLGSDRELTKDELLEETTRSLEQLAKTLGKDAPKSLDGLFTREGISDGALRTYRNRAEMKVILLRMEPAAATARVAQTTRLMTEFAKLKPMTVDELRAFPGAVCFSLPGRAESLAMLECEAAVGDVNVRVSATGTDPFTPDSGGVTLFVNQLKRLSVKEGEPA